MKPGANQRSVLAGSEFSIKAKLKLSEFLMVYFFRNTKKNAHMNMSHVLLAKAAYKDGC